MPRKDYKIYVQGGQRDEIDVALFVQALLAIVEQEAFSAQHEQSRQVGVRGRSDGIVTEFEVESEE